MPALPAGAATKEPSSPSPYVLFLSLYVFTGGREGCHKNRKAYLVGHVRHKERCF